MRKMKKILASILASALLISATALPVSAAETYPIPGVEKYVTSSAPILGSYQTTVDRVKIDSEGNLVFDSQGELVTQSETVTVYQLPVNAKLMLTQKGKEQQFELEHGFDVLYGNQPELPVVPVTFDSLNEAFDEYSISRIYWDEQGNLETEEYSFYIEGVSSSSLQDRFALAYYSAYDLYDALLFKGTGNTADGRPIFELERTANRCEAITMVVRLLGKEAEARSGNWEMPFTDVPEWARPYVGYAYANGLTSGISSTVFGSANQVTATQYMTFILRALGYEDGTDFYWDRAWERFDSFVLMPVQYGTVSGDCYRADLAIISDEALYLPFKDSDTTLYDVAVDWDAVLDALMNGMFDYQ